MTANREGNCHETTTARRAAGFLFVAGWVAFGFGDALLCLIGAAVFYAATAFHQGELDLSALQQRASQPRSARRPR